MCSSNFFWWVKYRCKMFDVQRKEHMCLILSILFQSNSLVSFHIHHRQPYHRISSIPSHIIRGIRESQSGIIPNSELRAVQ